MRLYANMEVEDGNYTSISGQTLHSLVGLSTKKGFNLLLRLSDADCACRFNFCKGVPSAVRATQLFNHECLCNLCVICRRDVAEEATAADPAACGLFRNHHCPSCAQKDQLEEYLREKARSEQTASQPVKFQKK